MHQSMCSRVIDASGAELMSVSVILKQRSVSTVRVHSTNYGGTAAAPRMRLRNEATRLGVFYLHLWCFYSFYNSEYGISGVQRRLARQITNGAVAE
jgi:hypothetical protein